MQTQGFEKKSKHTQKKQSNNSTKSLCFRKVNLSINRLKI